MTRTSLPRATALAVALFSSFLGAQQWQQATPTVSPSARNSHAMAFDVARGVSVLFGGQTGIGIGAGDHWEWDGANWTARTPATAPSARWAHAMAYDSKRMRVVLFGGFEQTSWAFRNDTWEFDGTTWTQRPTPTAPSARGYSGLAYDSARGVTVLFGGYDGTGGLADTWEWNGAAWSQRTPATAPSPRRGMAMAYDSTRNETVLFGGGVFNSASAETWTWNGTDWTLRAPASAPSARWDTRMAFDTVRGKALLHGGADGGYTTDYGDTWEWDGANWAPVAGTGPGARHGSAMAFDARKGQAVLFGGRDAGAFAADTWDRRVTSPSGYAVRLNGIDAYGTAAGVGGLVSNSTWEAWVRIPQNSIGGGPILQRWGMYSHALGIDVPQGRFSVDMYSCWSNACGQTFSPPNTLQRETWHHVALVYGPEAGPSCNAYVDGNLVAWCGPQGCAPFAGWETVLGAWGHIGYSGFLDATIDEARISSTARYSGNFTPSRHFTTDASTVGLWHFDEGTGNVAYDVSGHNRHFTLQGGFAWSSGVSVASQAATIATYGQGCPHSTNTPALGALNGSTPRLNQTLNVRLTGLPMPSFFVPLAFVGYRNDTALGLPLPFSMGLYGMPPQCQQYVEPDMGLVFTLTNAGGYADWSIFVPNQASLLGSPVYLQGLVFDWTLPYPLPAVSTNAAIATIGL